MNNLAKIGDVLIDLTGIKCALLVSLSTISHMLSFTLFDLGNPFMKSIDIKSHFYTDMLKQSTRILMFGFYLLAIQTMSYP